VAVFGKAKKKLYQLQLLVYTSRKPAAMRVKLPMTYNVFRLNYKHNYYPIQILLTITYNLKLLGETTKIEQNIKTK
jgi:hypothetical protein